MEFSWEVLNKTNRKKLGDKVDIGFYRMMRFISVKIMGKSANGQLYYLGKEFAKSLNFKNLDEVIKFCEDKKIGFVEVVSEDPLKIRIYECITCSGLPKTDETLCYFEGGFIAGALESIYKKPYKAIETHCAGLGHDFCQFDLIKL
ncbi:DUF2507 domain-containing protein [Methanocaldococcus sp.]